MIKFKNLVCYWVLLTTSNLVIANSPPALPPSVPGYFWVDAIDIGDYCWISGEQVVNDKKTKQTYLVNTPFEKSMCVSGDKDQETKLWHHKKLRIWVKLTKQCDHLPPCEANEVGRQVETLYDFQVIE